MLNAVVHGEPTDRPPLLIAHGLFGSARNWGAIAKRLSDRRQIIAVDMRNHGNSPWQDSHTYEDMASDLAAILDGPSDVLGHSMGGKASMVLALRSSEKVRRLVVADIAPVTYEHTQRPLIEAMRHVDFERVVSRRDADAQLSELVPEETTRAFLLQSIDVKEKRWRLNLDVLDQEMPHIMSFPEIEESSFSGPTLFLSGAKSDYVRREHRADIKATFPTARFASIPNAGHWLHAENPRAFEAAVETFLDA